MNFGERLKTIREQRGLSQQELADAINTSRSVISSYECNRAKPKFEHIAELAKALKTTTDYLHGIDELIGGDTWIIKFLYTTGQRLARSHRESDRMSGAVYLHIADEVKNMIENAKKD